MFEEMPKREEDGRSATHLPTSPGLIMPELTRRHGTEAAVFIILGASTTITGEPISSFRLFAGGVSSAADALDSHLMTKLRGWIPVLKQLEKLNEEIGLMMLMLGRGIAVAAESEAAIGMVSYRQRINSRTCLGKD